MITFEKLIEATNDPCIKSLDTSVFSPSDIVNIIMQRSEILRDQDRPNHAIKAWINGNNGPANALVKRMGDTLVRRAAAIIWLEYLEMKPTIDALAPKSVADIGCGYSIFDLFLWRDHPGQILLIDLESSDERHFGFNEKGAAYSNLDVAKRFLVANGVPATDIICRNPETADLSREKPVDLAVSFISCGFHYPVETYLDFFAEGVTPEGAVIVDLRKRTMQAGKAAIKDLGKITELTDAAYGSASRIMLKKYAVT